MIGTLQTSTSQVFPVQVSTLPLATPSQTSDIDLTSFINMMLPMMIMMAMMGVMTKMITGIA